MPTKTLSASLDPTIYRAAQRAAKEERRPQSAVVAEALRLYTSLPLDTRQLLLGLQLQVGEERVSSTVGAAIRAAALEARFQSIAAALPGVASSEREADVLAEEAVRWARKTRRG
jgi:hypothetical protein